MTRVIEILPIPVLSDNYVWAIKHPGRPEVALLDPGEAGPVLTAVKERGWTPRALLVTHHHWDHTGGIKDFLRHYSVPVYGPAAEDIPCMSQGLREGAGIRLEGLECDVTILEVPGHTRGAIAYYIQDAVAGSPVSGLVCSGDTLFAAGCGRLFEGTAEQMHASLQRFAELPGDTLLCCGHEYTCANLRFAAAVEPDNLAVAERRAEAEALREQGRPTVPAALRLEFATNPFLRCGEQGVQQAAAAHAGHALTDEAAVFAALRKWKDQFS